MDHKSLRYLMDQPYLNIRQHKWLDVVNDYDCEILYHPGKTKMMVDALSFKAVSTPIRDLFLWIIMITPFSKHIRVAQVEL